MTPGEFVTLRDYIDMRVDALEKATRLAADTMETRLEGMNEFRSALKDQNATFLPRKEYEAEMKEMQKDIRTLMDSMNMLAGKASQGAVNITTAIAILGLIVALASLLYK